MDKRIFIAITALFMVFVGFQFAEPVIAVKVVDHGTKCGKGMDDMDVKINWKTYQYNNNFMKTYDTVYSEYKGKYYLAWHDVTTIAKVTKSSVKITEWTDSELCPGTTVKYSKTSLTAARYYWRVYRSVIIPS